MTLMRSDWQRSTLAVLLWTHRALVLLDLRGLSNARYGKVEVGEFDILSSVVEGNDCVKLALMLVPTLPYCRRLRTFKTKMVLISNNMLQEGRHFLRKIGFRDGL